MQSAGIPAPQFALPTVGIRASRSDLIGGSVVFFGSLLAAAFSLQLWHAHLGSPFDYDSGLPGNGDTVIYTAMAKLAVHGTGWIYSNRQLGAPFGLNLADFPLGTDNLNYFGMWIIGRFTGNVAAVENIWFMATFPVVGLPAYALMRWMRISVPSSVVVAILFADSPYHLLRGELYLILCDYVTVPIAVYLLLSIFDGGRLVTWSFRPWRLSAMLSRRNLWTLLLVVVIGSTGVYYAAFAALLLAATGFVTTVRERGWAPLVQALTVVVAILAVCGLNDLPSAIYRSEHGKNSQVAVRPASDSEAFGLKLDAMTLPVSGDRIPALAHVRAKYDDNDVIASENQPQALGTLATLGLAWLLLISLGAIAGVVRGSGSELQRRQLQLGFLALVAFLLGTIGGGSALIAYLFFTQIRDWNRISIFIDLFALITVAMTLDAIGRRWLRSRLIPAGIGLLLVFAFGILDQSSLDAIPTYAASARVWNSDAQFTARIQRLLPSGSSVFELPYISFPESAPVGSAGSYDQLAGWLHSTDLTWSFPTIRGRPTDWDSQTVYLPSSTLLDAVVAAGFQGIWVDRDALTSSQSPLIPELQSMLDESPINSPDGRYAFFDIRRYAAGLRRRTAPSKLADLRSSVLNPPDSFPTAGLYGVGTGGTSSWAVSTVQISTDNRWNKARRVVFYSEVRTAESGSYALDVELPGGASRRFTIGSQQRLVEFEFALPPGSGTITLNTNAPSTDVLGLGAPASIWYSAPFISGIGVQPFLPLTASTDLQ